MAGNDGGALSRDALLNVLAPDGAAFASLPAPQFDQVDWSWVLRCAQQHKVDALVAARLSQHDASPRLSPAVQTQVTSIRRQAAQRGEASERTLASLTEEFGRAGIPFFVVKGSVLAHQVYQDPSLRRFADVDVIVRENDVARTEDVLRTMGFREGGLEPIFGKQPDDDVERGMALRFLRQFDRRLLQAYSWYPPSGGRYLAIDLHWHLARGALRISSEAFWQRTTTIEIAGVPVRTFDPAALVVHVATHATTCLLANFRLLHLCDLAWAVTRFVDQQDAIKTTARAWGVEAQLAAACALTERLLGIPLPLSDRSDSWRVRIGSRFPLLEAPQLRERSFAARLGPELQWSAAMRCIGFNTAVVLGVLRARMQLDWFRRRAGANAS